jgi:hypothetical protein
VRIFDHAGVQPVDVGPEEGIAPILARQVPERIALADGVTLRRGVRRASAVRDGALRGSVLRDSILRDSILRDSILRDSILRDSILLGGQGGAGGQGHGAQPGPTERALHRDLPEGTDFLTVRGEPEQKQRQGWRALGCTS